MIAWLLASTLMLGPVVEDDTHLRAVATGADVEWVLDGEVVAVSEDGEAVSFPVAAGRHDLHAVTEHEGPWQIMVRPEPLGEGASFVQAWTASHEPEPAPVTARAAVPDWAAAGAFALLGIGILLWPDRGPRRRPRGVRDRGAPG